MEVVKVGWVPRGAWFDPHTMRNATYRHLNKYTTLYLRYLGTLSLKGKKEIRRTKNESNVKVRKSGVAESADLSAYLQRMYPCEWEAEVD